MSRPTKRILHPSDFSRASAAAFAKAVQLANENHAELLVMHVLAFPMPVVAGDGYISPTLYAQVEASSRAWAKRQLDTLVAKARKAGARARAVLLEGTPYDRITRAARSNRADLIVIGTHGRTGLARLFLGSVATRVVSTAHCPVLTVRGR